MMRDEILCIRKIEKIELKGLLALMLPTKKKKRNKEDHNIKRLKYFRHSFLLFM